MTVNGERIGISEWRRGFGWGLDDFEKGKKC